MPLVFVVLLGSELLSVLITLLWLNFKGFFCIILTNCFLTLIYFSYNVSSLVTGNAWVNGNENYSSTFTDRIIIPAAYYTVVRTASAAPTASAVSPPSTPPLT